MGNWHISIQGVGAHHNTVGPHNPAGNAADANLMMADFVEALRKAGHNVVLATFTHGGMDRLEDPESHRKERGL